MKRNIPPWPKLATVQYWILSLILYLISIFALFAVPYPQFSNGMAALKCSPHSRNYNHIHAHLGLFSLSCQCLGKILSVILIRASNWRKFKAPTLCHWMRLEIITNTNTISCVTVAPNHCGLSPVDPPPARPPPDWASLYTLHWHCAGLRISTFSTSTQACL